MDIKSRFEIHTTRDSDSTTIRIPNIAWQDCKNNVPLIVFLSAFFVVLPLWGIASTLLSDPGDCAPESYRLFPVFFYVLFVVFGYFLMGGKVLGARIVTIRYESLVVQDKRLWHIAKTTRFLRNQDVKIRMVPAKSSGVPELEDLKLVLEHDGIQTEVCAHKTKAEMNEIANIVAGFFRKPDAALVQEHAKVDFVAGVQRTTLSMEQVQARIRILGAAVALHALLTVFAIIHTANLPASHKPRDYVFFLFPACILLVLGGRFYLSPLKPEGNIKFSDLYKYCPRTLRNIAILYGAVFFSLQATMTFGKFLHLDLSLLAVFANTQVYWVLIFIDLTGLSSNIAMIRKDLALASSSGSGSTT